MPNGLLSKHGNWIHLHQHPCISIREFRASHFAARFLLPGSRTEIPQAVRVVSIKE